MLEAVDIDIAGRQAFVDHRVIAEGDEFDRDVVLRHFIDDRLPVFVVFADDADLDGAGLRTFRRGVFFRCGAAS